MQQIYQVENDQGWLLMQAPMETIQRLFGLSSESLRKVEDLATARGAVCLFHAKGDFAASFGLWKILRIRRTPLEVPRAEEAQGGLATTHPTISWLQEITTDGN